MKYLVLCALVCCALANVIKKSVDKDVKIHPLEKVESLRETLIKNGDWPKFSEHLQRQKTLQLFDKADKNVLAMEEYMDSTYAWYIGLGTPAQSFRVMFSTMESVLWVPDQTCLKPKPVCAAYCKTFHQFCSYFSQCKRNGCCDDEKPAAPALATAPMSGCQGKRAFHSDMSSSYHAFQDGKMRFNFSMSQAMVVEGFVGYDDVQLFGMAINQYVCQVDKLGMFFQQINADGVMGFGFPRMDHMTHLLYRPFILNAAGQHQTYDVFSVYMNDYGGSAISVGGINYNWFTGDIKYMDVPKGPYWQMQLKSIYMGEGQFAGTGGVAVSSTSHNFIGVPSDVLQTVAKKVGITSYDPDMGMFTVLCNFALPDLGFMIDGSMYMLTYKEYVMRMGPKCYLAFKEVPVGKPFNYIFGTPFFRAYYHVFEYNYFSDKSSRIGLAKAAM